MELRHLTADDVPEAARVFLASLGVEPPTSFERFQLYWDVPETLGAFDERGLLLGVAATFGAELTAPGGAALDCTTVPSVGVRPDAHGRGVGRALLERQVIEAVERGSQVMALNASEVGIYGRYGYGPTSSWWGVEADPRLLSWRDDAPRALPGSVEELDDTTARQVLPELHERAFGRWAGELSRPEGWWESAFIPREGKSLPVTAVHRTPQGDVDAAVRFRVTQAFDRIGFANRIDIVDLFALDAAAEALLVRWLAERHLVGKLTVDRCNPRTPVRWMLDDPHRWVTTEDNDAVWTRILDVGSVLGARSTVVADGAVVIDVHDRLVAANDGTWRIVAEDGRLVCERTDAPAQLTIGVDLLASLCWGFAPASRLAQAGRIEVHDAGALPLLDRLLSVPRPSWCSTGF